MRVGIHLPQYGRAAGGDAVRRVARAAEELGFADVWVSDHVVHPAAQTYPSPYLLDPLMTLGWAAAVTERVGPRDERARAAAARAAVAGEGAGQPRRDERRPARARRRCRLVRRRVRGRRHRLPRTAAPAPTRSSTSCARAGATTRRRSPASTTAFADIRVVPQPAREIPIWVGGGSDRAYRRGIEQGDGFHVIGLDPEGARRGGRGCGPTGPRSRSRSRCAPAGTRRGWSPTTSSASATSSRPPASSTCSRRPWRNNVDDWLRSMELLAGLVL